MHAAAEECGLCYGVKRRKESRSGTSQNPQTPTPNLTPTKNTNHMFYNVRRDFWGMHRIDLKRDFKNMSTWTTDNGQWACIWTMDNKDCTRVW